MAKNRHCCVQCHINVHDIMYMSERSYTVSVCRSNRRKWGTATCCLPLGRWSPNHRDLTVRTVMQACRFCKPGLNYYVTCRADSSNIRGYCNRKKTSLPCAMSHNYAWRHAHVKMIVSSFCRHKSSKQGTASCFHTLWRWSPKSLSFDSSNVSQTCRFMWTRLISFCCHPV